MYIYIYIVCMYIYLQQLGIDQQLVSEWIWSLNLWAILWYSVISGKSFVNLKGHLVERSSKRHSKGFWMFSCSVGWFFWDTWLLSSMDMVNHEGKHNEIMVSHEEKTHIHIIYLYPYHRFIWWVMKKNRTNSSWNRTDRCVNPPRHQEDRRRHQEARHQGGNHPGSEKFCMKSERCDVLTIHLFHSYFQFFLMNCDLQENVNT